VHPLTRRACILVLAATAACGTSDVRPRWSATVDTVGDTITVLTTAGSVWDGEATLTPETGIGVLEGEDAYMLGSIRGLAVNAAGEIHALDTQVPVIRVYGSDGRHRADIGREGGGPGEYRRPDGGLVVLPDGRVLLRDPGNARMTVFSAAGEYLAGWPLPSGGSFNTSRKLYRDTAGNAYTLVLLERDVDVTRWTYGLARFTPDGAHTDTLRVPRWDYEAPQVVGRSENSTSTNSVPFSPSIHWTFSPYGYMVGGVSTDYRIDLFLADGKVLRIGRAWEPVPVDPAEKSDAEERITANMRSSFPGWRWNGPPTPGHKPPFRGIFAGDDGRIWVLLSQPGVEIMSDAEARAGTPAVSGTGVQPRSLPQRFREPVVFDVFEPDGTYLGRVRTPDGFSTSPEPVFRGDLVWAVERDELDVPRIVRYRIH
jgi:hypothetical protein